MGGLRGYGYKMLAMAVARCQPWQRLVCFQGFGAAGIMSVSGALVRAAYPVVGSVAAWVSMRRSARSLQPPVHLRLPLFGGCQLALANCNQSASRLCCGCHRLAGPPRNAQCRRQIRFGVRTDECHKPGRVDHRNRWGWPRREYRVGDRSGGNCFSARRCVGDA
jgi:hypothetical protein